MLNRLVVSAILLAPPTGRRVDGEEGGEGGERWVVEGGRVVVVVDVVVD